MRTLPDRSGEPRWARGRRWAWLGIGVAAAGGLLVVGVVATGDQRPDGAALRDPAVALPDEIVDGAEGPQEEPGPVTRPTCVESGCFTWVQEVPGAAVARTVVVGDVVVTPVGDVLVALDVADGSHRWRVPAAPRQPAVARAATTDDELLLALDHADLALSALDPDDGTARWRNTDLGIEHVHQARIDGRVVRVSATVEDQDGRRNGPHPPSRLVGLDADTGALLWQHDSAMWPMLTEDLALTTTDDGVLVAYGPDGDEVWRAADPFGGDAVGRVQAHGPLIQVTTAEGSGVLRAGDGTVVDGLDGDVIGTNGDLAVVHDPTTRALSLFDDGDVRWTTDAHTVPCVHEARIVVDTILIIDCDTQVILLDRGNGTIVGTIEAMTSETVPRDEGRRVGTYSIAISHDHGGDTLVRDLRAGRDVAHLPPHSAPVGRVVDGLHVTDTDLDGQLVIAGDGWLAGLPHPDDLLLGTTAGSPPHLE